MKTIGIVCDNYKVDDFTKELTDAGYKFSKITANETTTFVIHTHSYKKDKKKIGEICRRVQIKNSNLN